MRIPARPSAFALAACLIAAGGCAGRSGSNFGPVQGNAAAAFPRSGTQSATGPWIPAAQTTFAVQYGGHTLDTSVNAKIYDVDGFDTTTSTVAALHAKGRHVVCYIDVGTWENWRPDAGQFPKSVLGKRDGHWAGERWLDIRQRSILEPIMRSRFRMCRDKGFDAVDPDNIDGYENHTGFPISGSEQITYDRWVAKAVHALGLSVAQKNDNDQIAELRASFDWAVLEQCYAQRWCDQFTPYTDDGRLVVDIEYGTPKARFINDVCPETKGYKETALLKHLDLNAWVVTCPKA
ncbi:MAG: endo alpha-1,4 polygalactosaminidase [Candidatus Tumulicola sp.]